MAGHLYAPVGAQGGLGSFGQGCTLDGSQREKADVYVKAHHILEKGDRFLFALSQTYDEVGADTTGK